MCLEGVARGGAGGVGAVVGVDVAHGLCYTDRDRGGRVSRIGAGRSGFYSRVLMVRLMRSFVRYQTVLVDETRNDSIDDGLLELVCTVSMLCFEVRDSRLKRGKWETVGENLR